MSEKHTLLTRRYYFRAIHSLDGVCDDSGTPLIHGHDYDLEVTLKGTPDPDSGWVLSRDEMDQIVEKCILIHFDKSNLNDILELSSGERAVNLIHKRLQSTPLGPKLHRIALQETAKNRFVSGRNLEEEDSL